MIVLIVLTVLSSCTIRKAIQAQWEVPVAKQLNPSKSIFSGGTVCAFTEVLPATQHASFADLGFTAMLLPLVLTFGLLLIGNPAPASQPQVVGHPEKIPFYILYRKLKIRL